MSSWKKRRHKPAPCHRTQTTAHTARVGLLIDTIDTIIALLADLSIFTFIDCTVCCKCQEGGGATGVANETTGLPPPPTAASMSAPPISPPPMDSMVSKGANGATGSNPAHGRSAIEIAQAVRLTTFTPNCHTMLSTQYLLTECCLSESGALDLIIYVNYLV